MQPRNRRYSFGKGYQPKGSKDSPKSPPTNTPNQLSSGFRRVPTQTQTQSSGSPPVSSQSPEKKKLSPPRRSPILPPRHQLTTDH